MNQLIYGIIYKTTNFKNGKYYIGQTIRVNNSHYYGSGIWLNRALRKYGLSAFEKEVIDEAYSQKELNEKEMYWIAALSAQDKNIGYNLASGGSGGATFTGRRHSKETRKKMSESHKGRKISPKTRAKISAKNSGKNHPCFGRRKEKHPMWGKIGENNPNFGSKRSLETRIKMSKDRKGKNIGKNNPAAKQIKCFETGRVFWTIREAAKYFDVSTASISNWIKDKITKEKIGYTLIFV
jgi:group I intron endonuclease